MTQRLKAVDISGELFQEWITEGCKIGGPHHIIECMEGLPEGARFVNAQYRRDSDLVLSLIFEHPDFDMIRPGDEIPRITVKYGRHRWEP